ncbi:MAG: lipopolysaccharide heptosyltransferase II [Burkholderiales bacterium]
MMERALVIAPQWIGDAVMSQPLVAALVQRGAVVAVAALPWVAPVYRAMSGVQQVIVLPFAHGRLDLMARVRIGRSLARRFDVAYVLPNSFKSALLPWFAGIARRIGYQGEGRRALLTDRLPNPRGRPPMVPFYRALAQAEPGDAVGATQPHLHVADDAIERALAEAGGLPRAGYWVFAPGAEYGPAKCWPASHYAELARMLQARLPAGAAPGVVLLGSAKEAASAAEITAAAPGACVNLIGRTSLDQAMALIAGSRGVVSNDSGLMHVAAAFGLPQVAVFGSSSPIHTPPLNPRARVLWLKDELGLDCAPCFDRVCRFGHTRCLTGVPADRARQALVSACETTP